jgi:molybdopterin converting factor small subunit
MRITIHLLGQARQLAARDRLEVELPDHACVDDALPALLAGADQRLATVLAGDDGRLSRSVLPILRDETIDPAASGLLRDGDELSLLPPMSGG